MIPNRIEKEIVIEAPVDVVWRVLTQPDQIREWFRAEAQLDLRTGGRGRLASYEISVEAVDPLRRFAFRWVYPEGATPDTRNSTLVEFTLSPEARGTRLRVVESGFDHIEWSDAEKVRQVEEHTHGWMECLERLANLASRHAGARGQA